MPEERRQLLAVGSGKVGGNGRCALLSFVWHPGFVTDSLTYCVCGKQGKAFQTYTLIASSDDKIENLKMKVLEQATGDMYPNQMQLYHNGKKIEDDTLPLYSHGVKQGV